LDNRFIFARLLTPQTIAQTSQRGVAMPLLRPAFDQVKSGMMVQPLGSLNKITALMREQVMKSGKSMLQITVQSARPIDDRGRSHDCNHSGTVVQITVWSRG
jgi:hypothetical protein